MDCFECRKCGLLLAVALAGVLLCAACHGRSAPPDPGLASEDFGSGIKLLSDAEAARSAVGTTGGMKIEVVTPDDLNQAAPYDRAAQQDKLLIVTGRPPAPATTAPIDCVTELRCYLASAGSTATLLGKPLSSLTLDTAEQQLGKALNRTESGDAIHLDFAYAYPGAKDLKLGLMLSFHAQQCFAARLHLISPQPKF